MTALEEYAKWAARTKEIADAATGSALYTCGGYRGLGRGPGHDGYGRGGREDGHQYKCTHCKLESHTTEDCRKRKSAQSGNDNSGKEGNDERTCYQCGLPGHFKVDCIHFKRVQEQRTKVKKATATASLATAGDRDLL
jgi:hypothetical protein